MAMKILEDIKNPLYQRREIKGIISSDKNPSIADTSKELSEQFKTGEDAIVISQIKGGFGTNKFRITVRIYDSKEARESAEPAPKEEPKEGGEKPAEQPVEQPAPTEGGEEKPAAEEKKEEKAEEKPTGEKVEEAGEKGEKNE